MSGATYVNISGIKRLDKMLKVCLIAPTLPYMNCGVAGYTAELIESLLDSGLRIGVISSCREKIKQFAQASQTENFSIFPIVSHWDFPRYFVILKKIREFKPDVIHIQYHWQVTKDGFILKGLMMVLLPLILKLSRVETPVVATLHNCLSGPYLFPKAGFLRRWALLPLLLFSDRIMVTNSFDGTRLVRWLPFLKNKIYYVKGGSGHYLKQKDLRQQAGKVRAQLKNCEDEIILSNFGFMIPYKGLEELLEAMNILRAKGYPLRLLAIGGPDLEDGITGSYFEQIQKMAEQLNLKPYISWTGFCDAQKASLYLLASDICVMPLTDGANESRSSFVGVLSHGVPVITTYTERTPKELIDKVNVRLVPPRDALLLAEAIEELIAAPGLRESLGQAATELYSRQYDWSIIAKKTINTYQEVLERAPRPLWKNQ